MRVMVTGHRPPRIGGWRTPNPTEQWVRGSLRNLLTGLRGRHPELVAISGMALGVDQIYAEEALALDIPVHAAIPFEGQESMWPEPSQAHYRRLLERCTEITHVCPPGYAASKMIIRDHWMVDNSDLAIAVWDGSDKGGTATTVRYIRKQARKAVHLNPVKCQLQALIP